MGKKRHFSARGTPVNWDELLLRNKNVVAVGNVPMNAMGDRLGPGGKVIQRADQIKLPPADIETAGGQHR